MKYIYKLQQQTGYVSIYTDPPGATVYIDNQIISNITTPMIVELPPGNHTYRIVLSGYNEESGIFTITSGLTTYVYHYLLERPSIIESNIAIPLIVIVLGAYLTSKLIYSSPSPTK